MVANPIFAPEAEQDISQAYNWYEDRRPGLGEEFLSCVDAAVQAVCRRPEMYPFIYRSFRRIIVRRFPYSILYKFEGTILKI